MISWPDFTPWYLPGLPQVWGVLKGRTVSSPQAIPRPVPARIPTAPGPSSGDFDEGQNMAIDWGDVLFGAVGGATGNLGVGSGIPPLGFDSNPIPGGSAASPPGAAPVITGGLGPEACEGMIWSGGTPPKGYKVVNWCGKGVLRKIRRRRRRRLLTASDKSDIAAIVGLVGKGQMASSLITRGGL